MKKRLLLVGWDSADWKVIHKLLDRGGMQGVRSLMDQGVHGNLATLEPQLSPMLWTSIATGKMAWQHGIQGFTEVDPVHEKVVPVSAASRKCKTVWEILGERGLRSHVVGWFATHGEKQHNGCVVSNMYPHIEGARREDEPSDWPPAATGTYWPDDLSNALNDLRVSPHEIDEEVLLPFIPEAHRIDQNRDGRLNRLRFHLAEAYSVHSAATYLMEQDPDWDFMAVYYRALDEVSHSFMPYFPPKMEGIPQEDFEIYQHVIEATYRAHDMMLQRLMHLAGPETTVLLISDHGFHSDHLRPRFTPNVPAGITVWHRSQGILLAKGPGIRSDDSAACGAQLPDITPTILHHFGLPVGQDMAGRVVSEIFRKNSPVSFIPSWEETTGTLRSHGTLSPEDSELILEQFVDLGYIDEVSTDPSVATKETRRENSWNLARAYLSSGKNEEALPLLEDCFATFPERTDYAQIMARTQLRLGLIEEAEETLSICFETLGEGPGAALLQGQIEIQKGDFPAAFKRLEEVRLHDDGSPQVLGLLCICNLALQQWEDARRTAELLLKKDPDSYQAQITLGRLSLEVDRNFQEAVDHALVAIGLQFGDIRGHALLGRALMNLGEWPEARQALTNCLSLEKNHEAAARDLLRVYQALGDTKQAEAMERELLRMKMEHNDRKTRKLAAIRTGIEARSKERLARLMQLRQKTEISPQAESEEITGEFIIVSGLPRSGTSLMMQILEAGGIEPMTDGRREADESNPEGYYEWEEIKKLRKNPQLIRQADGKAIKVVSALLPALPPGRSYKVIFMRRPIREVVASQRLMLERNGRIPRAEADHLIDTLSHHLELTLTKLRGLQNVDLLEIDFPSLMIDPEPSIEGIRHFLDKKILYPENLGKPIKPALYRNKISIT